jgi:hypothetical protein
VPGDGVLQVVDMRDTVIVGRPNFAIEHDLACLQAHAEGAIYQDSAAQQHGGKLRIEIDIRLRPRQLNALLDVAATPFEGVIDDETAIVWVPVRLRRAGREIRMVIDGTDPFAASKPDARLIKLLLKARRFNATLVGSDDVAFAALAEREGVSPSYFTRLVRLSYLAPDITHAILDGHQPRDLTAEKLLEHSRLPLAWHDQRTALGFA